MPTLTPARTSSGTTSATASRAGAARDATSVSESVVVVVVVVVVVCWLLHVPATCCYRLVGLVVKASASRAEDPGFESRLRRDFSGSSHTRDSKIGTPVATLPRRLAL